MIFRDNKGNTMHLDGKLTIEDLIKLGVTEIRMEPDSAPLQDNWWRDAGVRPPSDTAPSLPRG